MEHQNGCQHLEHWGGRGLSLSFLLMRFVCFLLLLRGCHCAFFLLRGCHYCAFFLLRRCHCACFLLRWCHCACFLLGGCHYCAFFLLRGCHCACFLLSECDMVEFFLVDPFGFFDSGLSLMSCLSRLVRSWWVSLRHISLFTEGDVLGESVLETMHIVQCFFSRNDFTGVLVHGGVLECSIIKPFLFDVTADRIFKSPYIRCEESGRFCGSSWHVWI